MFNFKPYMEKTANTNVAGDGGTDTKITSTMKTDLSEKNPAKIMDKRMQQPTPKLAAFNLAKTANILGHASRLVKGIGKAVGKSVKGGARANKNAKEILHRGNIGKALTNNAAVTGTAVLGSGAYGTHKILS
ncbi:hypothetical protein H8D85_01575 [bacterium]|nr:hypothetical protein [bacterium]